MRIVAAVLSVLWIVLTGTLGPASAWNHTGHQVVALIAWDNLSPGPRGKLVAMMRQAEPATRLPSLFPEDKRAMEVRAREFFRRAATWPDLIRDVPELQHPTWHHRDFYWRQDQGRAIDLPDLHVHPENLLERLHYFKKLLASRTVPARERAIGIAWVLHLVGDVHQPLHCSARVTAIERKGDHGGQDFELAPRSPPHPRESGIPCTPTGTTCSTGLCPGDQASDWASTCSASRLSSCPIIRGRSVEAELKPGQFDAWARESVSPPRASIRRAFAAARSRPPTI